MKMLLHHLLCSAFYMAASSVPAPAQGAAPERYPLSTEAVAHALHADGLNVQAADLRMPMAISTAVNNPALELVGVDRLPDGHLRLRLRCRRAAECLPFSLTLAHTPEQAESTAAVDANAKASTGATLAASALPAALPGALDQTTTAKETAVAVHAGAHLTMLMEDGHMHIHLPVMSLSSAKRDSEVRVATLDGKHTFRATVINGTTVRGIME